MITIQPATNYKFKDIVEDLMYIENNCFDEEQRFDEEDFKLFCNFSYNFFLCCNNRIVGYIMCDELDDDKCYDAYRDKKTLHIISIAIMNVYQRKGYAARLIDAVTNVAIEHEYKQLLLDATSYAMRMSAIHNGFVNRWYFKKWGKTNHDCWIMTREVKNGI